MFMAVVSQILTEVSEEVTTASIMRVVCSSE
jgi:hypothetical protein